MALLKKSKQEETTEKQPKAAKVVKKTEEKAVKKEVQKRGISKKALTVLIRPMVTEKTAQLSDRHILVFEVAKNANRIEIKDAFKELYGIVPAQVNVLNVRGKKVAFGRALGKRKDWKKAVITLPEGTHVDIFEGI